MTTTKYILAQPTQLDDNFYNLFSTTNQSTGIVKDLKKQRRTDNHYPMDNYMQEAPIELLSQQ